MATCSRREKTVRSVEYAIPAGSAIAEFDKAQYAAFTAYCQSQGIDPKATGLLIPDNWARVEARDDEVVIAFDVEEKPGVAERALERVRQVYADLMTREVTNAGKGRDGHLNEDDLALILKAIDGEADRG